MKKLKLMNFASAYALMLVIMFSLMGCEKTELPDLPEQTVVNPIVEPSGGINFNIDGLKSGMAEVEAYTERGTEMILSANANGLPINNWYWNITDGQDVYPQIEGQVIKFTFYALPGSDCSIELVGVVTGNQTYVTNVTVKVVYNFDMTPMIVMREYWYAGNNNYAVEFCVSKNIAKYINTGGLPGRYWWAGDPNGWVTTDIAAADTNVNLNTALQIVNPPSGEMGKYYKIRIYAPIGEHWIGTGKKDNTNAAIWLSFLGEPVSQWVDLEDPARFGYEITGSGEVVPVSSGNGGVSPGVIGDDILKFAFSATYYTVYTFNGSSYTSTKYAQLRNSDFTWKPYELQSAVTDYPQWGQVNIDYAEGQNGALFCMRYGNNFSNPGAYNPLSSTSDFWDPWNKHLAWILKDIGVQASPGDNNGDGVINGDDLVITTQRRALMLTTEQAANALEY